MSIFSFPTTEIIFWGAGKKCRELVRPALGYDSGENNFDFLSQDEYLAFANNRARPIASYIHQLITKMEADDAYYYDTADTSHILVRQNVYAIKWYFASLEHYYQYAAPAFERLCDQIVPTSFAMPSIDSGPYDIIKDEIVRINNIYPFEGTVSSETYAKSLNKNTNSSTKDDDTSEESGFEENSKLSKPGNPYPELNDRTKKEMEKIFTPPRRYLVTNAWEFCFATCKHLSLVGALDTCIRQCDYCEHFYIRTGTNSKFCTKQCRKWNAEQSHYSQKERDILKLIRSMLREQEFSHPKKAAKDLFEFERDNIEHRDLLTNQKITHEEYEQWLNKQHQDLKIHKPEKTNS